MDGVKTVFDGGAGSGRFSIPLAALGMKVTHFDISLPMLEQAQQEAEKMGVGDNITFVNWKLEDLTAYADREFDMVLSIDAPISYTYPHQYDVLRSLIRIAGKKLVFSVAGNMGWIPYLFNPAQKAQYILDKDSEDPFVKWTLDVAVNKVSSYKPDMAQVKQAYRSQMMAGLDSMKAAHEQGKVQWPHTYAFMPGELKSQMEAYGAKNVALSGPGALSRSIPNEVLVNIMNDSSLRREFLDFCYEYDSNIWCAGMGKDNLVACADV